MPRSVNAVARRARRKKIMKQAKGFFGRRKNVWTVAKNAVEKAMQYAYRDRRNRKRDLRALWITRINNAAHQYDLNYSQLINGMKKQNIAVDRKILAELAVNQPAAFQAIVEQVKKEIK